MERVYQFRNLKTGVDWTNGTLAEVEQMKKFMKYDPNLGIEFRTLVVESLPPPELTWLFTHCRAIGMTKKSESGKWEHDIAAFTIDLQEHIKKLERTPTQFELIELARKCGAQLTRSSGTRKVIGIKMSPEMLEAFVVALKEKQNAN